MNGHATFLSRRTLYGFLAVVPVLIALGSFVDHPLSLALYLPVSPALLAGGRPRSEWFSAYKNSRPCRAAVFYCHALFAGYRRPCISCRSFVAASYFCPKGKGGFWAICPLTEWGKSL